MRNIKKLGALLLAMVMCLGLSVTAFAAEGTDYSITVNNAVAGHTYKLYKMMGLSVNADKTAYSYYVDQGGEWKDFFADGGAGAAYVDFSEKGNVTLDGATVRYVTGFKTGKDTPTEMVNFGHAAETYAANKTAVFTATLAKAANDDAANNNVVAYTITDSKGAEVSTGNTTASDNNKTYSKFTFTGLEPGYYLVVSSVGTNAIVGTTPDDNRPQVNEKNSVPTLDKTITTVNNSATDDKNNVSASIGDTIGYNIHVVVPGTVVNYTDDKTGEVKSTGAENYVIHDKISKALTLDKTSVTVERNGTAVDAGNYDIVFDGTHCAMEIAFKQAFLNTLQAGDQIDVDYIAMVNENALVGTFGNTAYLNYGGNDATGNGAAKTPDSGTGGDPEDPDPDPDPNDPDPKPGVHTYEIDVYKFARLGTDKTATGLAGAKFTLYRGETAVNFVKIDDSKTDREMAAGDDVAKAVTADRYRVATAEEISSGKASTVITTTDKGGLIFQGLAAGDYRLSEVEAPAGYNKLDKDITITVNKFTNKDGVLSSPEHLLTIDGVATNNASVENAFGTQMPETGGIGTTLFYIIGGLLVVGAVVFLVARKRVGDDGEE